MKILKIENQDKDYNLSFINVNEIKRSAITDLSNSKPDIIYGEQKTYYKKILLINNKKIEIFPSCDITNKIFEIIENLQNDYFEQLSVNEKIDKELKGNKTSIEILKKSFFKRLKFLFTGKLKGDSHA